MVLVSKVIVAPERVELTVEYSIEVTWPLWVRETTRKNAPPAVSELGPWLPTMPMIMSFALVVVTPVTVG